VNISTADLQKQVDSFPAALLRDLYALDQAHGGDLIGVPLLLAFASRETDCRNIEGDHGYGNGMFQIDSRFWAQWLLHQKGCRSGSNKPAHGHSALEHGYVPTIQAGAVKCLTMFVDNYHAALAQVKDRDLARKIATSAYNAGLGGALRGQREHGDSDYFTTGGDYHRDVLGRASAVFKMLRARKLFPAVN
jgi:hypothetical protein